MKNDLTAYRASPREQNRIRSLFELIPARGRMALDIGARDGHISQLLAERFDHVVALDLEKPDIPDPRIEPVKGNAAALTFDDDMFDAVVCAEVLEHIPGSILPQACAELLRVARGVVIVGVPYRQDLRCGRTTCQLCGGQNPPWGHVNSFDEKTLQGLFPGVNMVRIDYVGANRDATNAICAALLDFAGNPFGTYEQDEPCIHCGHELIGPRKRSLAQKAATKVASTLNRVQQAITRSRPMWIHVRFDKRAPMMEDGR